MTANGKHRGEDKPSLTRAQDLSAQAAVMFPVADLVPWKANPKKHDGTIADIIASIKAFGFGAPVLARLANCEIIAGHGRVKAAKRLGMAEVPVRFLDLTERQAHALALRDQKLAELADWTEDELAAALAEADDDTRALFANEAKDASSREDLEVEEVDVSTAIGARFWMTVHGPLPSQPDALERLRKVLGELEGVTVETGLVE